MRCGHSRRPPTSRGRSRPRTIGRGLRRPRAHDRDPDPRIEIGTVRAAWEVQRRRTVRGACPATRRDRCTGCLRRPRAATRSDAHRVEERGDRPSRRLVLVSGEPGIGKTRLAAASRARSPLRAWGCCTGGVTTGGRSRTRRGCTCWAASYWARTTTRSLLWRRWRRISCAASRSSASGCPVSCRGHHGCSVRSGAAVRRGRLALAGDLRAPARCCWCSTICTGPIRRRSGCSGGS